MLSRFTVWVLVVGLAVIIVMGIGSAVLSSQKTVSFAILLDQLLQDYDSVLRAGRYMFYTAVFLYWPALGRRVRAGDRHDWGESDVRGWNGYRYRLVAILTAIDIVIIDQWPFRLSGV